MAHVHVQTDVETSEHVRVQSQMAHVHVQTDVETSEHVRVQSQIARVITRYSG